MSLDWSRLQDIFDEAWQLDAGARERLRLVLDCGGNLGQRGRVLPAAIHRQDGADRVDRIG